MSNNTSLTINEAGSLILSEPYLLWLEKDVFPYIFGPICLLSILTSIIFNIAILKLFSNEVHIGIRRTIYQFAAVDVLAVLFVLAPGMYKSFSKLDDISTVYCHINGVMNQFIYLIQFGTVSYGLITSFVLLRRDTQTTEYLAWSKHVCLIVCIYVISFIFALIPTSWDGGFVYNASEYFCGPNRANRKPYVITSFCIGLILSFLLTCIVSTFLIKRILLKNTKVSHEMQHPLPEVAAIEENMTKTNDKSELPIVSRNRFKSDETVSIEDQTRVYVNPAQQDSESGRNRFKSDVTVSMEDHTRSYNNVHFKDSAQTGITISMEDRTHSYITRIKCQETETELEVFGGQADKIKGCLQETSSSDSFIQTSFGILNNEEIGTFNSTKVYANDTDTDSDSYNVPFGINYKTSKDSIKDTLNRLPNKTESEDEISVDESYVSRHEPSTEFKANRLPRIRINGDNENVPDSKLQRNWNPLAKLLRTSNMNKDMTVKFVTTNIVISSGVIACWMPFVILVYIEMYGTIWWKGWLTLALLCAYLSYCIKPIMILGIRGQLIKASKVVLPKSVESKTDRIVSVLKTTMDKVGKTIY